MSVSVGYPGPPGSHSNAAAAVLVPDAVRSVDLPSFVAVVDAASAAEVTLGVLPIESSLVGPIAETHDLLFRAPLSIVREATLPIRHCIVGLAGATFEDARTVLSHPAAFDQCRDLLGARDVRRVPTATTADAAREVADAGDPGRWRSRAPKRPPRTGSRCWRTTSATGRGRSPASSRSRPTRRSAAVRAGARRCRSSPTISPARSSVRSGRWRGTMSTWCSSCRVRFPNSPWRYRFDVVLDGHVYDEHFAPALRELRELTRELRLFGSYAAERER